MSIADIVEPHAERLEKAADKMEAAGLGLHCTPSKGTSRIYARWRATLARTRRSGSCPTGSIRIV